MKPRLMPAHPAWQIGARGHAVETVFRIGQLVLLVWLAVAGAKFAVGALIRGAEALLGLLS
jgi:hypothetical protein